jgi:hypothetical protein
MKKFLRRTFVDSETPLATMNSISGGGFLNDIGRRSQPLLDVALAVFTLLILDSADGLARQQRMVLAGLLGTRLNIFGLNMTQVEFDHLWVASGIELEAAIIWHAGVVGQLIDGEQSDTPPTYPLISREK